MTASACSLLSAFDRAGIAIRFRRWRRSCWNSFSCVHPWDVDLESCFARNGIRFSHIAVIHEWGALVRFLSLFGTAVGLRELFVPATSRCTGISSSRELRFRRNRLYDIPVGRMDRSDGFISVWVSILPHTSPAGRLEGTSSLSGSVRTKPGKAPLPVSSEHCWPFC